MLSLYKITALLISNNINLVKYEYNNSELKFLTFGLLDQLVLVRSPL